MYVLKIGLYIKVYDIVNSLVFQSGGFYSAEDADSYATVQSEKKQEGAFCVWTAEEIRQLLPDPVEGIPEKKIVADVFMHHYGMKEDGNVNPMKVQLGRGGSESL